MSSQDTENNVQLKKQMLSHSEENIDKLSNSLHSLPPKSNCWLVHSPLPQTYIHLIKAKYIYKQFKSSPFSHIQSYLKHEFHVPIFPETGNQNDF